MLNLIMKGNLDHTVKIASCLVYVVLALTVTALLFNGPIRKFLDDQTMLVTGTIKTKDLNGAQYATMVLCHNQHSSIKGASLEEDDKENATAVFEAYLSNPNNSRIESFVEKLVILPTNMASDAMEMPLAGFSPFIADVYRMGICFSMDMKAAMKGFLEKEKGPPAYSTKIGISMKTDVPEGYSLFLVFMVDPGEELMLAHPPMQTKEVGRSVIFVNPGLGGLYKLRKEHHSKITHCSREKLSDCVERFLNDKFGRCRLDQTSPEEGGCDVRTLMERALFLENLKMEGLEAIRNETGCVLPCKRMHYETGLVTSSHKSEITFPNFLSLFSESASFVVISVPHEEEIVKIDEVKSYDLSTLMGDVGGFLGLFLGLSIWGLFEVIKMPLVYCQRQE